MKQTIICGLFFAAALITTQTAETKQALHAGHHHDHSQHLMQGAAGQMAPGSLSAWMFEPSQAKAATVPPQMNPVSPSRNCPVGTSDEPFGDRSPEGCPPPSVGDPISLTDGSFWMTIPCFKLGGAGRPISFGLHYDTHKWADSIGYTGMGVGWVGSYSRRLNPNGDVIIIVAEDGAWKRWTGNATVGFTADNGNNASLSFSALQQEYTVRYRNGETDIFNASGMLKRVEDRSGNTTLVSEFVVANGIGSRVIRNNRTNQSLILEHTDINDLWRLTKVTENTASPAPPRQMTLAYGTAGFDLNKLTKITDVAGRVYTFSYDARGRIQKYWDPNNDPAVRADAVAVINEYATPGWSGYNHGIMDELAVKSQTRGSSKIDIGLTILSVISVGPGANGYIYARVVNYQKLVGSTFQTIQSQHYAIGILTDGAGLRDVAQQILYRTFVPTAPGTVVDVLSNNSPIAFVENQFYPNGRRFSQSTKGAGLPNDYRKIQFAYDATTGAPTEVREYSAPGVFATTTITNDQYAQPLSVIDPAGIKTLYSYDSVRGWPTQIQRVASDSSVIQTTVINYAPVALNSGNIQAGLPTSVTLPDGTVNTQTYDIYGYPRTLTMDAGAGRLNLTESTFFNFYGFLSGTTDRRGISTSYEYGTSPASGQYGGLGVASAMIYDSLGRSVRTEYQYDAMLNPTRITADAGAGKRNAVTTTRYALVGNEGYAPDLLVDSENQVTRFSYDAIGRLLIAAQEDPLHASLRISPLKTCAGSDEARASTTLRYTRFCYTPEGFLAKTILDDGRVDASFEYTGDGLPRIMKDARGVSTQYVYDGKGRLARMLGGTTATNDNVSAPINSQTDYSYDALDRITQVTSKLDGGTSRTLSKYTYDGLGRLAQSTDGAGNTTSLSYHPQRDWLLSTVAGGNNAAQSITMSNSFDALGRLLTQSRNAGSQTLSTSYQYAGSPDRWLPSRILDAKNNATSYKYNSFGSLQSQIDAKGSIWRFDYDNLGFMSAMTPPAATPTNYGVDTLGRQLSLSRDGQTERWRYNQDGTLASYVDFAGQTVSSKYDGLGRLIGLDYSGSASDPNGARSDVSNISYLANDLVSSVTSTPNGVNAETTSYQFDAMNRLSGTSRLYSVTNSSRTVGYGYHLDSTLKQINYWGRGAVNYGYGTAALNNGLVRSIDAFGSQPSSYGYASSTLMNAIERPSGVNSKMSYDSAGRLNAIAHLKSGVAQHSVDYQLDANGNRTQMTERMSNLSAPIFTSMGYDALNRMIRASQSAAGSGAGSAAKTEQAFTYDATGNRTTISNFSTVNTNDINRDGYTDMPWNQTGNGATRLNRAWIMGGGAAGNALTAEQDSMTVGPGWTPMATGDITGDGQPEILWRGGDPSGTTSTSFWNMQPNSYAFGGWGATLRNVDGSPMTLAADWEILASADFNQDDTADLFVRNRVTGENRVRLMSMTPQGPQQVGSERILATVSPSYRFGGIGDFDRDGNPDLIWHFPSTLLTIQYLNADSTMRPTQASVASGASGAFPFGAPDANWTLMSIGDYNYDGAPDLYWRHVTGVLTVWPLGGDEGATQLGTPSPVFVLPPGYNPIAPTNWNAVRGSNYRKNLASSVLSYNARDQISNAGFSYDGNGNLLSMPAFNGASAASYSYTAANKLQTSTVGGITTEYFYDGAGNLIRQIRAPGTAGAVTTEFVLDESGSLPRVIGEIVGNTETLSVFGPEGLHAQRKFIGGTGQALEYPLSDGLGSIKAITDASGTLTKAMSYDVWGSLRYDSNASKASSFGFTGEQQYADGTINLRARSYVPSIGRFLQRDSFAGFSDRPQSLNRYAYVEGNPGNLVDPSGMNPFSDLADGYADGQLDRKRKRCGGWIYDLAYDYGLGSTMSGTSARDFEDAFNEAEGIGAPGYPSSKGSNRLGTNQGKNRRRSGGTSGPTQKSIEGSPTRPALPSSEMRTRQMAEDAFKVARPSKKDTAFAYGRDIVSGATEQAVNARRGLPEIGNSDLANRLLGMPKPLIDYYSDSTKGAGTHAEVRVFDALLQRGSVPANIEIVVFRTKNEQDFLMCSDCGFLTQGANAITGRKPAPIAPSRQ